MADFRQEAMTEMEKGFQTSLLSNILQTEKDGKKLVERGKRFFETNFLWSDDYEREILFAKGAVESSGMSEEEKVNAYYVAASNLVTCAYLGCDVEDCRVCCPREGDDEEEEEEEKEEILPGFRSGKEEEERKKKKRERRRVEIYDRRGTRVVGRRKDGEKKEGNVMNMRVRMDGTTAYLVKSFEDGYTFWTHFVEDM